MPVIPILTSPTLLRDGVYQVKTRYCTAGFVIRCGKVTQCAPILQRRLAYYLTIATRIGAQHAP